MPMRMKFFNFANNCISEYFKASQGTFCKIVYFQLLPTIFTTTEYVLNASWI